MIDLPVWPATAGAAPSEAAAEATRCLAQVDAWAEALRDHAVIAEFSEVAARSIRTQRGAELLDALESFSAQHWDFRRGRERNLAERPEFSSTQVAAIDDAAGELGLMGTPQPRHERYDAIIMTGGMVRAGIVKPRFARELHEGGLGWQEVVFLGGFRSFAGDELAVAPALGVTGDNEFDAMAAGMRLAFGLGEPDSVLSSAGEGIDRAADAVGNDGWREDSWSWRGHTLRVVAAPSADPKKRRANTADTYRFWASRATGIRSVLVVTTPVYVPYQGAAAIEVLGLECGLSVETVAVSASASDLGEYSQAFRTQHRAQELRSAVHGMRSLRSRLARAAASD